MKKRGPTTMAMWGVSLSLLGIFTSIGFAVLYFHYYHLMGGSFKGANVAPIGR